MFKNAVKNVKKKAHLRHGEGGEGSESPLSESPRQDETERMISPRSRAFTVDTSVLAGAGKSEPEPASPLKKSETASSGFVSLSSTKRRSGGAEAEAEDADGTHEDSKPLVSGVPTPRLNSTDLETKLVVAEESLEKLSQLLKHFQKCEKLVGQAMQEMKKAGQVSPR